MKRIAFNITTALLALLLVTSCDISRLPKEEMDADTALQSVSDLRNWERDILVQLRKKQGGLYEMVQDLQADELLVTQNEGNHYPGSISWESATTSDYNRRDVYIGYYQMISNINFIFGKLANVKVDEKDKAEYNVLVGRLHFYRAYAYANLALRYGTPYKAQSAGSDLCVPLHLTYDNKAKLPRATNKEVYNQILNVDLKAAKEMLASAAGKAMMATPSLDAVKALEARVYLYMSDWNNAYKVAKELIDGGKYPLVEPKKENFVDMWLNDKSTEEILLLYVARPDETTQINTYFGAVTDHKRKDGSNGVNLPNYLPTQSIIDLFVEEDLRKSVYFEKQEGKIREDYYDFYLVSKRKGNPKYAETTSPKFTYWNGYLPNSMHNPKVFRIAEQYLIAAEAAFKTQDQENAKKFLNKLRASRGLAEVTESGDKLWKEIMDERARELAFEGFRLWDLRRWGLTVDRTKAQHEEAAQNIYKPAAKQKYEANHPRMVWPIPANDINTNPAIANQQNPGW